MNRLTNSSELEEASSLFCALLDPVISAADSADTLSTEAPDASEPSTDLPLPFRGDQLEKILYGMCKRGGFSSAVVADRQGLALGVYNSPVDMEVLAAFTTVLGETINKAGRFLDQHEANNISLDINYADKAVVRQFFLAESPCYIMVICPQYVDERSEIELSLDQIITLLQKR
ncbi:MAG: hypothetical protein ABIJ50_09655 [Pseudomonadota bacterium]